MIYDACSAEDTIYWSLRELGRFFGKFDRGGIRQVLRHNSQVRSWRLRPGVLKLLSAVLLLCLSVSGWAQSGYYRRQIYSDRDLTIFQGLEGVQDAPDFPAHDEPPLILVEVNSGGVLIKVIGPEGTASGLLERALDGWEKSARQPLTRKWKEYVEEWPLVEASLVQAPPAAAPNGGVPDLERLASALGAEDVVLWASDGLVLKGARQPRLNAGAGSVWVISDHEGWWLPEGIEGPNPLAEKMLFELLSLLPLIGIIGTWLWAMKGAKGLGMKTLEARQIYCNRVLLGLRWFSFLPLVAVAASVLFGAFSAYAEWLSDFAQSRETLGTMLPLISFASLLISLPLLAMNKSVMGPNEEELKHGFRDRPRSPLVVTYLGWRLYKHLPLAFIGILIATLVGWIFFSSRLFFWVGLSCAGLVIVVMVAVSLWAGRQGKGNAEHFKAIDDMNQLLGDERLKVNGKPLKASLLKMPHVPRHYAVTTGGTALVTPELLTELGAESVKFVIAHEVGHAALKHVRIRKVVLICGILAIVLPPLILSTWMIEANQAGKALLAAFGTMAAPYGLLHLAQRRLHVKQEFQADEWAVKALGTAEGGIAALTGISLGSAYPGLHQVNLLGSHPPIQERVARMKAIFPPGKEPVNER